MAQAGAAAGGEVVVAVGPGGEEEFPDVRFLMEPKDVGIHWYQAGPFADELTVEEKDELLIKLLRLSKIPQEELNTDFRVSDALNRQPAQVVALNAHASGLSVVLARKRRHCIFLQLMLQAYGQKRMLKIEVPHRYRNIGQLTGDIKALKDGIKMLYEELVDVCLRIRNMKRVPVKIPGIFEKDL